MAFLCSFCFNIPIFPSRLKMTYILWFQVHQSRFWHHFAIYGILGIFWLFLLFYGICIKIQDMSTRLGSNAFVRKFEVFVRLRKNFWCQFLMPDVNFNQNRKKIFRKRNIVIFPISYFSLARPWVSDLKISQRCFNFKHYLPKALMGCALLPEFWKPRLVKYCKVACSSQWLIKQKIVWKLNNLIKSILG